MKCGLLLVLLGASFSLAQVWLYEESMDMDSIQSRAPMELDVISTSDSVPGSMEQPSWMSVNEDVKMDSELKASKIDTVPKPVIQKIEAVQNTEDQPIIPGISLYQAMIFGQDNSKPVDKAEVVLRRDTLIYRGVSDANGIVIVRNIPAGDYSLKVSRKGFATFEKDKIRIRGTVKYVDEVGLEKRTAKGKMIEVAKKKASGTQALMAKREQSNVVIEGVSAEQIAKSTDADAGAIAKRVTGTSVVGGKYVFVRGLGERYTNMTLNGLPVPTPEKDKRVVPQDLFPANALESFSIYKTFNADLPADFAGGSVALETKRFPDKNFMKFGIGIGGTEYLHDGEWFDHGRQRLITHREGILPWIGFENSTMAIPNGVPRIVNSMTYPIVEDRANFARKFDNNWAVDSAGMAPDQSYSFSMGRVYNAPYSGKHGFIANASFKNDFVENKASRIKVAKRAVKDSVTIIRNGNERRVEQIVRDTVDGVPAMLQYLGTGLDQQVEIGKYSTTFSGLLNWGYENRDHILWFKSLYANLSDDVTLSNYSLSMPDVSAGQENPIEERFYSEFTRRSVSIGQAGGGHYIGKSVLDSLAWAVGLAKSSGVSPDSRKYYYSRFDQSALQYDIKPPFGTRQYQDFGEFGLAGRIDLNLVIPPEISEESMFLESGKWISRVHLPTLDVGNQFSLKSRDFDVITYSWAGAPRVLSEANDYSIVNAIHDPDSVYQRVMESSNGFATSLGDYDTYRSTEIFFATYMNFEHNLQIMRVPTTWQMGIRHELYSLDFTAPFTSEVSVRNPALREDSAKIIDQFQSLFYPAASIHFELFPKTKTRFLWSTTRVRPEIRERAPTFFFDPQEEIEVIGNPELLDTKISNYDLRFEWFLPYQQLVSFSLFYKDFTNPIEAYVNGNLSPNRKMFQNAKGAYVRGIELEADFSPWRLFGIYANAAWIQSQVRLDTTAQGAELLTSRERPLIGQSPYLYNIKLTVEREIKQHKIMNALLYNISGRRIRTLGVDDVPDVYEEAFGSLDYLMKWSLNRHSVNLKLKNLLNSTQQYTVSEFNHKKNYVTISDVRRDSLYAKTPYKEKIVINETKPGIGVSIGYDLDF